MKYMAIAAIAVLASASTGAMAQSGNSGNSGGVSGNSGNVGGLAIDFAAGVVPGLNYENKGGYAKSIEEAFSGVGQGIGGAPAQGAAPAKK
jgi:hypothetical protein